MQQQQQKTHRKEIKATSFGTQVCTFVCVCVCAWWSEVGSKNAFIGTCSNQTSRKHSHARLTKTYHPNAEEETYARTELGSNTLICLCCRSVESETMLVDFLQGVRFGLCSCFPVLLFVEKILMTSFRHDPCHLFDACFFFLGYKGRVVLKTTVLCKKGDRTRYGPIAQSFPVVTKSFLIVFCCKTLELERLEVAEKEEKKAPQEQAADCSWGRREQR